MASRPWAFLYSPEFEADYRRLCRRNAALRTAVDRKVEQVLLQPLHDKPLRAPLQGMRRVHVGGSYVILFQPDRSSKAVRFLRLAHHDEAYGL